MLIHNLLNDKIFTCFDFERVYENSFEIVPLVTKENENSALPKDSISFLQKTFIG